ncbi:MAG: hypothetical protein ACR2PY_00415 [Salinispira sp.]
MDQKNNQKNNPKNNPKNKQINRTINKKLNSVFFIIGATVLNLVIMIGIFILLTILYGRFLAPHLANQTSGQIILVFIFFISVIGSYVFYHLFIKWISNKIDMEKYFDPIFRPGRKKR